MERRQNAELLHSEGTEATSLSVVLPNSTSELGPSHSDSGVDSLPTSIPSATSPSFAGSSPSSTTPLTGSSDLSSSSPSTFFSNKGAVAGVFVGLGVLILSILGIIYLGCIRRRQRQPKQRESRSAASVTFSTLMRRFDANPNNRRSEARQTFSMQQTNPQFAPSRRISVNVPEWLARRRERRSSQFPQIIYHSRPASVMDYDTKHFGEGTQWTLGNVLENQREQVITPIPPIPRLRPKPPRSIARALGPRASRGRRESEGGQFTVEDALLRSLSSSTVTHQLSSGRSGRHPYAQA